ncbi:hypothetical protein M406DRAFT_345452 [Cryphonectria parasitica EP155]|uniref:Uncharacterized protein n=1 Tax=Cryphonectria parasitica (strain ATCC 38755 / EP155) TaxID=660469 RepID=A0A9P4Y5P1_CRYP1|nr:uncharacterized protein M406DRAFT_345452 [Cryphonectria parasitica EP155]KAF3767439.1 hypothetical protein M406DRAFT_345452 [Cryphonectria parasitica EP155]
MAEFVNWDHAEQVPSGSANQPPGSGTNLDFEPVPADHNFDLALANIDGDDFSFWALEHFETSHLIPGLDEMDVQSSEPSCDACRASGSECRRVDEGRSMICCTSCAALDISCSFSHSPGRDSTGSGVSPPKHASGDHIHTLLEDVQQSDLRSSSSPDLNNAATGNDSGNDNSPKPPAVPKIGARFSRDSVRILKTWLSTHSHRPYPNDEERERLQKQTGLNKTQIANWLANARRRSKGKFQRTRSTSPSVRGWTGAVEIPRRRGTPAFESEYLSPLQRWENSPPENEPASVTAIASAILHSNPDDSGINSPFNLTDDDAGRSCKGSSASSFGTSPSSASFASAYSRGSRGSFQSFDQRGRRRRRRRTVPKQSGEKPGLNAPPKTFQCTFCTESFRTKHDWQRHEKSLHLSLERWVCSPNGPRALNPDVNKMCCVFCAQADPDDAHIESHNHTACQEKPLNERTFYRKDHLRQHLKLVHNTKYLNWNMDSWKAPTPDIRSRCGFCGSVLGTWPARVDHLAEHFKTGSDMKSWKGDWGFEPAVLSMVENSIPPFMIHDERTTPLPFQAGQHSSESPRNAYELLKFELVSMLQDRRDANGATLTDDELQHEACRIIYASDALSKGEIASHFSWLRDLLMSRDELRLRAQLGLLRGHAENYLGQLRVNGKDNIFEGCAFEKHLSDFVRARTLLGLSATNEELQVEACNIVGRMEDATVVPSEDYANFLLRLILRSPTWLSSFRQRAGLHPADESFDSSNQSFLAPTVQNYSQLERELAEFVKNQRATDAKDPSDDELQKQARCIVYKCQNSWQPTAADNPAWLTAFKQRCSQDQSPQPVSSSNNSPPAGTVQFNNSSMSDIADITNAAAAFNSFGSVPPASPATQDTNILRQGGHLFLNGSGCYRRLARELARFVGASMSPNNPNQHVPTDQEIQHQARWIIYDDDDPFNHTPADNAEWLQHFKRSVGIIPADVEGSDLSQPWGSETGGPSGPKQWQQQNMTSTAFQNPVSAAIPSLASTQIMQMNNGGLCDLAMSSSVGAMELPLIPDPGAVFASREFENKLVQFAVAEVASSGRMPPDEAIQARAKEILGMEVWQAQTTPADDAVLLVKFKELVVNKVKAVLGGHNEVSKEKLDEIIKEIGAEI